jgi:steroid delta-isomerase
MPTAEVMRDTMKRYLACVEAQDVEGVLALFADRISIEDPVGGPPATHVIGLKAVGSFFREGFASSHPHPSPTGPIVTTSGNESAMSFTLRLELRGSTVAFDVIDVMRFDESGKIESLRAFWNAREGRRSSNA